MMSDEAFHRALEPEDEDMTDGHKPCSRCRHRLDAHVPTTKGWACDHCDCRHSYPPRPVKGS